MIDIRRKPSTYGYGYVLKTKQRKKPDRLKYKEYHEFKRVWG